MRRGALRVRERALIRYRVKPSELERHLELLRAVYAELEATGHDGLRWGTFRLDDEHDFVEVVFGEELPQPLPQLASFRRYRAGLDDRCEERSFTDMTEVASYRLLRG